MLEILNRIKRGERVDHYETTRRHKDGTILHISLSVSPIYDPDGRLIAASKVSRDITAAKNAEIALKQSETQLQEMHAELLHVSRLSAMGQVAAMLAHELNQPLTAISNYMEAARVLLDRGGDLPLSRIGSAIDRAAEQALRAGQIIQRLRGFVSRGNSQRRIEAVSPLLKELLELALFDMGQRGVSIRLENTPADVRILADKIQIRQVLLNLLRDAAEAVANQEHREISLLTEASAGAVQISVVDNGPGRRTSLGRTQSQRGHYFSVYFADDCPRSRPGRWLNSACSYRWRCRIAEAAVKIPSALAPQKIHSGSAK